MHIIIYPRLLSFGIPQTGWWLNGLQQLMLYNTFIKKGKICNFATKRSQEKRVKGDGEPDVDEDDLGV